MTTIPTVNPTVSLTNDQAFSLAFAGGDNDAEGFATGAAPGVPTIALQDASGAPLTDGSVVVGNDPAAPDTFWFKRGQGIGAPTLAGAVLATFADGEQEQTPFAFAPGAAVGVTETENVVPLASIPTGVAFPTPPPVV